MTDEKVKKKRGRPPKTLSTSGLPENWKEIVIQKSLEGCSDAEIRRDICLLMGPNVKNITMLWYALKAREPEFLEAINMGKTFCEAWWLQKAREGVNNQYFQSFLWFCNMKNRFGWVDKTEVDHGLTDETYEKMKELSVDKLGLRFQALIGYDASGARGSRPADSKALGNAEANKPA